MVVCDWGAAKKAYPEGCIVPENDPKQDISYESYFPWAHETETNSAEAIVYQTELLRTAHGAVQRSALNKVNRNTVMVLSWSMMVKMR